MRQRYALPFVMKGDLMGLFTHFTLFFVSLIVLVVINYKNKKDEERKVKEGMARHNQLTVNVYNSLSKRQKEYYILDRSNGIYRIVNTIYNI